MSASPFRFVHASDFHLEQPPVGVVEVPDHLRELFLESPYWAAERVFETVLSEEAEFLVLSGDILHPERTGPRGPLFLGEQFQRLAEREIPVYWAGGIVDPPEVWPSWLPLPGNVHIFPRGRVEDFVHQRSATPLARLVGQSRDRGRSVAIGSFDPDPAGLFSIGVLHGNAEAPALQARGLHYWALGGKHGRSTLFSSPQTAHYPGSPQGRHPHEYGAHGCTLVHVDQQQPARTSMVPTDVMRWLTERVTVDEATTRDDLENLLRERMHQLAEAAPKLDLLISWTVVGNGPLLTDVRRGNLAADLLGWLRTQFGFGSPAVWSLSLETEPAAVLPPEWYEQETIRGDFLRGVRHYQMNPEEPIDLEPYLSERQLAGTLSAELTISDKAVRQRVLREAALLGVDLLSGEEPQP